VHLVLSPRNRGLSGREIELMKPSAILVNLARADLR
jgi:phosphoglycerate dehydrogenase-like enzyme